MKKIIDNILNSFNNAPGRGYSGKKMTAFAVTVAYCYSHRFLEAEHLAAVLAVDGALITALFGINTYDKSLNKQDNATNQEL